MNNIKIKKSFKVILNSNDTTSWTGPLGENCYRINPQPFLKNEDYNKKYKVYFSIEQLQNAVSDIVYGVSLDISGNKIFHTKALDGLTTNNIRPIHFIATFEYQNFNTNKRSHVCLDDQSPIIVQLCSLNYIRVIYCSTGSGNTFPSLSNHIICLRFEEL